MDEGRDPAPWSGLIDDLNARLAAAGLRVHPPEPADGPGWLVRIETADGLADFVPGPTAAQAWMSAMAWLGE